MAPARSAASSRYRDRAIVNRKETAYTTIDTNQIKRPVLGFILDQKGLMYNLTLEGSKISRISR